MPPRQALEPIALRIAPLGWHINLQLDGRDLAVRGVAARAAVPAGDRPGYADVARPAAELARQRCLWASNRPHPNVQPPPDEAALLAWARATVGGDGVWRQILVRNPARL